MDGEREWSSLNREVGFMQRDLERLRDLRWDTKVALSVLDEAIDSLHEKGSLSSKDLAGLNARIADRSCRINPDRGRRQSMGTRGALSVI